MTTIVPRLNMTDAEMEDAAQKSGVKFIAPTAEVRRVFEHHLQKLALEESEPKNPPKADAEK